MNTREKLLSWIDCFVSSTNRVKRLNILKERFVINFKIARSVGTVFADWNQNEPVVKKKKTTEIYCVARPSAGRSIETSRDLHVDIDDR